MKSPFEYSGNSWGRGGLQRPPVKENPGGWGGGLQIIESSVVGVWIFSGTTQLRKYGV